MSAIEVIARAIIRRGRLVLLARERGGGWFFLPGGHVEFREPVEAALVREIREELGAPAVVGAFRGTVENAYDGHHEINLVFEVTIGDPDPVSKEDHLEFVWMPADAVGADVRPAAVAALLATARGAATWSGWGG